MKPMMSESLDGNDQEMKRESDGGSSEEKVRGEGEVRGSGITLNARRVRVSSSS